MIFGYLMLAIAVIISSVAAYYSVAGLTAIFSAAVLPVIIMGGALEAGKIAGTVWLHNNWERAGWVYKTYLVPAIAFLMLLTSMGIFGFLSKAHNDQALVSGDVSSKIAIYDEKIKIARENIEADRKALKQMDEAVDQVMGRSSDEKGADKAVYLRKNQQKERARLQAEIQTEQKAITSLNDQRAPIAAEVRKVEAEVGPLKYIAAFIYGSNPDGSILEKAVTWVIMLIVVVFDPLALCLILAANKQLEWAREGKGGWIHEDEDAKPLEEEPPVPDLEAVPPSEQVTEAPHEQPSADATEILDHQEQQVEPEAAHAPEFCPKCSTQIVNAPGIGPFCPNRECDVFDNVLGVIEELEEQQRVKEIEEFFDQAKLIARGLDADEDARVVNEANQIIAALPPDDTNVDIIDYAQQASDLARMDQEREELQQALSLLVSEYDQLGAHLPELERQRDALQRQLNSTHNQIIELDAERDSMHETVGQLHTQMDQVIQQRDEIESEWTNTVRENQQLRDWNAQLEQDLRVAIQLAHDKTQELNELRDQPPALPVMPELDLSIKPDADLGAAPNAGFGTEFPKDQKKGDMFLRVDYLPSRLYKWNDTKWIEIDKDQTDRYAYDQAYIKLLVDKIKRGEYDFDDLNSAEQTQVTDYINSNA